MHGFGSRRVSRRNSWGESWGEMGFYRVERGKNLLNLEEDCAWAELGHFTTKNVPCAEDGANCLNEGESLSGHPSHPYHYGEDEAQAANVRKAATGVLAPA